MVIQVKNRFFPSNTYLIKSEVNMECVVIDPGLDSETIHKTICENNLIPVAILCTHGHFDHVAGVALLKKEFGNIPYYLHKDDLKIAKSANFYLKLAKIKHWIEYVPPDYLFEEKAQNIDISGFTFQVFQFPGHSDGSCVIKYENQLFSGDIIYKKGLGFNNFPGENTHVLKESIKKLIALFKMDILVYPGHGDFEILKNIVTKNSELLQFLNN